MYVLLPYRLELLTNDVRVGWLAQTQLSLSIVGLDPIAGTICGPPIIAHSAIPGFSAIYSTLQTPPGFDGQIMLNEQYLFFTATAYDNTNAYPHWGIVRCASDSRLAKCARVCGVQELNEACVRVGVLRYARWRTRRLL